MTKKKNPGNPGRVHICTMNPEIFLRRFLEDTQTRSRRDTRQFLPNTAKKSSEGEDIIRDISNDLGFWSGGQLNGFAASILFRVNRYEQAGGGERFDGCSSEERRPLWQV